MSGGWTVVLDVGKSLSKLTLWDEGGVLRARRSRPNMPVQTGDCVVLDTARIEEWLVSGLAEFASHGPIDAIVPVAHGAAAALIRHGRLQVMPLDYEWSGVAADRLAYDQRREPFKDTGSPPLPAGLNLGIQLHWLESRKTANFRGSAIVPWAQYWGWVLSGVAAAEVSSLGCHTDLWRPFERTPSHLAVRRGWAERLAPLLPAHAVLGTLKKDWVEHTGLSPHVQVLCGLHDSNAALLAARARSEIKDTEASLLSTGTWFVAMRTAKQASAPLPQGRDCLVNVDVNARPTPSARFMGGREIELMMARSSSSANEAAPEIDQIDALQRIIAHGDMILPTVVPGVGPFPHSRLRRIGTLDLKEHQAVLPQLYAALVADFSLDLIGGCGALIVEGRFAQASVFMKALASLRRETCIWASAAEDGVAQGALSLLKRAAPETPAQLIEPLAVDFGPYRSAWREAAERHEHTP